MLATRYHAGRLSIGPLFTPRSLARLLNLARRYPHRSLGVCRRAMACAVFHGPGGLVHVFGYVVIARTPVHPMQRYHP